MSEFVASKKLYSRSCSRSYVREALFELCSTCLRSLIMLADEVFIDLQLIETLLDCNALLIFALTNVESSKTHGTITFSSYVCVDSEPFDMLKTSCPKKESLRKVKLLKNGNVSMYYCGQESAEK